MKSEKVQILTECAIMIALSVILSMIKVYEMPLGGSITLLSMLPVMLISIRWGLKIGFGTCFVYAAAQLFLGLHELMGWGMTPFMWIGSVIFDYIIAFTVLCIAGAFRKKSLAGIIGGIALACVLRFISHFISGTIFFDTFCPDDWNVVLYSVVYNIQYMLPEMIITIAGASFLFAAKPIRKLMNIR